jgi:Calcium/calmodulin dependent protein kinase II association domain
MSTCTRRTRGERRAFADASIVVRLPRRLAKPLDFVPYLFQTAPQRRPESGAMQGEHEVLVLERAALARWLDGDPSGYLEISDREVVYFDPFLPRRLDGLDALTAYYEGLRGKISALRSEILNPCVQAIGDAAVLTFNFISYGGNEDRLRWNCTEVYRRTDRQWRIVQTHWSFTEAGIPNKR